jgi:holo-[acyl-carrier-protein] synthase
MSIYGIGCDIADIKRVEALLKKPYNLKRIWTENELLYIKKKGDLKALSATGIFSAKEAFVKALGTGFGQILPNEIEITHNESGKPYIKLLKSGFENFIIHLSISHTNENACAFVVIEGR